MADVLILLLRFVFYVGLAMTLVLAVLIMPGWWWALMAMMFILFLVLGIAQAMGKPWAHKLSKVLFWPRG